MKKLILAFFLNTFAICGYSQNLITNWSFEDTIPCVINPMPGVMATAPPWKELVLTPDFQSENYCGIPFYYFGYQSAKSGISFSGGGAFDSASVVPGIREVFGQELQDSLIAGHRYCVSFFVNLATNSRLAIDKLGALFTSIEIDQQYFYTYTLNPQIENSARAIISDTLNWIEISGDFIAQGGEKFISIGNFRSNGNFQLVTVSSNSSFNGAYYYFDDISVIDCSVGIGETVDLNFNILPNLIASKAIFKVSAASELRSYRIISLTGQILASQNLAIPSKEIEIKAPSTAGVFIVEVFGRIGYGKTKIMVY